MSAHEDAAQDLARRSFVAGVFPLRVNSKHEHKTGHEHDRTHATKDAAIIAAMWAKSPRANIGWLVEPGYVAVDSDPDKGGDVQADESTYDVCTSSGPDYLHVAYRLPDGMTFTGTFDARPGVELHGAGQRMTGAGSTIGGKAYRVVHDAGAIALAPAWVVDAIVEHEAQRAAIAAMRATSTATLTPTQPIDSERGQRWADAGLLYEAAELHNAPSGTRYHAIKSIAYKAGQFAAYLDVSVITEHMLAACVTFDNQAKVAALVRRQIAAGALNPRHPAERDDHTGTRRALAAMVALLDSAQWAGKMPFAYRTRRGMCEGNVRAATIRAALTAILQQATKGNTFDVNVSLRHLCDMIATGRDGASRVLHALQHAGMLKLIEASDGLNKGNTYRLTAAGFLAVQRAAFSPIDGTSTASVKGNAASVMNSSSHLPVVVPSIGLTETDAAQHLGVFGHRQLGRNAYVVARALALAGELTAAQIVAATGMSKQSVSDVLKRLAEHGLIERGGRAQPSRLADDFMANAMAYAEDESLAARQFKRRARHAEERQMRRIGIEAAKARLAAEQNGSAERDELAVIEPPPAPIVARVSFKAGSAIEALRNRGEVREWRAARDLELAAGAPRTRVEFGDSSYAN